VSAPALEARALTKRYGDTIGIEDVDLRVERGERLGFLGPNGAGKTTFLRTALGLLRPTAGSVAIMGHPIGADNRAALAEVGYLPGEPGLPGGLTGRELLEVMTRLHPRPPLLRERLLDALELSRADLGRRIRAYSRGMRQKLSLVVALQHDPPLAVLDEPSSGLDPVIQERLTAWLIERSRAGRTLLFSSHVLGEVEQLCERVAMIREGRLLVVERLDALRGARTRVVRVTFAEPVDPTAYAGPEVSEVQVDGARHRFVLDGPPAPLLGRLAALPVAEVAIEPPRLEDVFRALYAGEDPAR
jgi:ABC-2 type transport system ATP-binding protein